MNKVPDRKQLRRQYLRQKGALLGKEALALALFFPAVGAAVLLGMMTIVLLVTTIWDGRDSLCWLFASFALLMIAVGIIRWNWKVMDKVERRLHELEHVPPVSAAVLPAEEILVRGSTAPPASPAEVLLRPAQYQETPSEELLRPLQEG